MGKARAETPEPGSLVTEATDEPPWMLDQVDERLIGLLERDGRMSYAELGTEVGLTPGGARARVKRLQERGVVRVIGVTSPHAVGLRSIASLQIEVEGDIDRVADEISQFPGVRYLVLGSGNFSLLAEVYAQSSSELFSLINRQIREVSGVSRISTFLYEAVHTHRPVFPTTNGR
ncbi:Lrp/AsnC family transcriptional regulator for asnA, asnC and gidA [Leucobacter luti]|uniref:Lrp/AsnC family transcriptional regulator n=1 Tax=Leucobacter luti TaxID=340320 RepID=UPI00104687FB|nr:Lrp/AsnC family transcriptional regulator [Leucobacter luti]MCW2288499.1 Lrp/AsnC family transcriptional regulator for asnA, asnC and gidA [Leucobacter luti]TCK45345.1 Lrp/AsnC family transcriptional regulator for asnA, asnC and gidA [Leucobacter luti]